MGVFKDILNIEVKKFFEDNDTSKPRDLTDEDRAGWADAQDARMSSPMRPKTMEDVQRLIRNRNPIRWRQVRRDFRWVQKEMKKLGLNPEDARFIL